MKSVDLLVIVMLFLYGTLHAERTVWYVHPDSALNTIQAGLDSCANNDIVLVGPGTYLENIVWPNTQGIHLIGELGPEMTVIDGDSAGCVIDFYGANVDSNTAIQGFTILSGYGDPWMMNGGGISCWSSSPTIKENIIVNNTSGVQSSGGGIQLSGGSPIIVNNLISSNFAYSGGGIGTNWYSSDTAVIIGNTITDNNIYGWNWPWPGSAINCHVAVLNNNIISGNSGNSTASIYCEYAIIDSCTISNNYKGVSCGDNSEIHYCNIFGNDYGVSAWVSSSVNAEYNWWGDASGPYHPTLNPGGLGNWVSDNVDFIPWLTDSVQGIGVEEHPIVKPVETHENLTATIFRGPLQLPEGKKCKVFDITGRVVDPQRIRPGIYFIEIDGIVTQKVVKVR